MSIFGVSEEQVRLIIRDELLKQSTNQQAPQPCSVKSTYKDFVDQRRKIQEQSCRHFLQDFKQERYQENLNLVRDLSRDLAIGERRLASMEFEVTHYNRDGYAISAMHYACIAENIQRQSVENGKIHSRLHKVLDDLSKLNVI